MSIPDQLLRLIKRAGRITKPVLKTEFDLVVQRIGDAEFGAAMERLVDANFIKGTADKLTGDTAYACTPAGIKRATGN